jgi:hypothetical protein
MFAGPRQPFCGRRVRASMTGSVPFAEMVRRLAEDPVYRQALTQQLAARAIDADLLRQLIAYARSRQTTMGQAMTRQVLTDAGVSWEAL